MRKGSYTQSTVSVVSHSFSLLPPTFPIRAVYDTFDRPLSAAPFAAPFASLQDISFASLGAEQIIFFATATIRSAFSAFFSCKWVSAIRRYRSTRTALKAFYALGSSVKGVLMHIYERRVVMHSWRVPRLMLAANTGSKGKVMLLRRKVGWQSSLWTFILKLQSTGRVTLTYLASVNLI